MSKPARTPQFGPGNGSGRRPIPADLYLTRWNSVAESLKAGLSTAEIKVKHGTCAETVRRIRGLLLDEGWIAPMRVPKKKVRPPREPKPPRVGMTVEERLRKYSRIADCLRAGMTMAQAAQQSGVSVKTVQVIRRGLVAQGEVL